MGRLQDAIIDKKNLEEGGFPSGVHEGLLCRDQEMVLLILA
jgi:hypothetical protein